MNKPSHFDNEGKARMVDVTDKKETCRVAVACATALMKPGTVALIMRGGVEKGDVLGVARVAGIMAAKKTHDLIPMCHPLNISLVAIDYDVDEGNGRIGITATVRLKGRTGVEMEALTAVTVAALTIYDMLKAVDREMVITGIMLLEKRGGKGGVFKRERPATGQRVLLNKGNRGKSDG
jgi:cyclic pyranopterin phosphate synthase